MAILRLVPPSGPVIEITREQSVVGRDPSCDVVVADGSVSRKHARIEKRGADWAVVDQGSANGTFLDSLRVAEVVLRHGQEVRFGAMSFRVDVEGTEDLAATMAGVPSPEATVVDTAPSFPARAPAPPPVKPAVPPPVPKGAAPPLSRPAVPPPVSKGAAPPVSTGVPPPRPSPPPPAAAARPRARAIPAGPPVSPVPQVSSPPPAKKGRGPFFWIGTGCCGCLLLVLALFGIIGGSIFFMTRGAVDAVQAELRLIKGGSVDLAYEGLSEGYRQELSRKDFERLIARHPGLKDNSQALFWPPVGSVKVENDLAHLTGVLVSSSGRRETAAFELSKEKGAWRITGIRFEGDEASP